MNSSVLSAQDSNNQKKKDSFICRPKYEEKFREKRNYTEYTRGEEGRVKQIKREPSCKRRETSKENFMQSQVRESRTSQSK
jgi:hypothetical protein